MDQRTDLPARRIELVVEGAGALVMLELLRQADTGATSLLRHVNHIYFAFPVANHGCLLEQMQKLQRLSSKHPAEGDNVADLANRR